MNYRDLIRTANANLRKSKLRTTLTILAVFLGALTLMLTTGVGAGLKAYVNEQVGAVGAKDVLYVMANQDNQDNPFASGDAKEYDSSKQKSNGGQFNQTRLQASDLAKIRHMPGVKNLDPIYPVVPEYVTSGGKKYQAALTQTVDGLTQPLKSGRLVNEKSAAHEVTLTPELVVPLGFTDDQTAVGKNVSFGFKDSGGELFTVQAKVVGVQAKALINGNQITANTPFAADIYKQITVKLPTYQKDSFVAAFVKFDNSFDKTQIKQLQDSMSKAGYQGSTLEDQLGIVNKVISGITTFLTVFAGIALVAATFGIINTLLMAVQERTREIGLMKALGMSRSKIFMLFSLEAILIGFWGALLALGAATLIGRAASTVASRTIFKDFEGLQMFSFPAVPMIAIILLIMAIAFIAATLPARRAARLDPIEALRYE